MNTTHMRAGVFLQYVTMSKTISLHPFTPVVLIFEVIPQMCTITEVKVMQVVTFMCLIPLLTGVKRHKYTLIIILKKHDIYTFPGIKMHRFCRVLINRV